MAALAEQMYVQELCGFRRIADHFGTNHHSVKRLLVARGVTIGRTNASRPFSAEHRAAISAGCKGRVSWCKGKTMPEITRLKNGLGHLRFDVDLEWAQGFDLEVFMMINKMLTPRLERWRIDTAEYVKIVERFSTDAQFLGIFKTWIDSGKELYLTPSLDHIVPAARGGTDTADNLQVLTWFENRCKNDMTQTEWDAIKSNINRYFV